MLKARQDTCEAKRQGDLRNLSLREAAHMPKRQDSVQLECARERRRELLSVKFGPSGLEAKGANDKMAKQHKRSIARSRVSVGVCRVSLGKAEPKVIPKAIPKAIPTGRSIDTGGQEAQGARWRII